MRTTRLLSTVLLAGTLLATAACGDDDDGDAEDTSGTPTSAAATSTDSTTGAGDGGSTTEATGTTAAGGDDGAIQPPARDDCVRVPERPDDVYRIAGVGEVRLRRGAGTLELVEARAEQGWEVTGDERDDPDEVEVEFRGDGTELEDGRLEIVLCDDED